MDSEKDVWEVFENEFFRDKHPGDEIAKIGDLEENGNWPTHLHLQLAKEIEKDRILPHGMIKKEELEHYKEIYPDPSFLIPGL